MPTESIIYFAAVAITCALITKIVVTHSIAAQRRQLGELERRKATIHDVLKTASEQRTSATDTVKFYGTRLTETQRRITEASVDLELLEAAERKHLSSLGYDEETIERALESGHLPELDGETAEGAEVTVDGEEEPDAEAEEMAGVLENGAAPIEAGAPVAVVPAIPNDPEKLFLPDAVAAELVGKGVNVVDRFTLNEQIREAGEDLESILVDEHYFRLGAATELRGLVVVNSKMQGSGVGSANCRVVELPSGKILLSAPYEQPGETESSPEFEPLTRTAEVIIEAIGSAFGTEPESTSEASDPSAIEPLEPPPPESPDSPQTP